METFYIIVLSIAILFLILILTSVGILLSTKNNIEVYPPMKNDCPDYWQSSNENNQIVCTPNNKNYGKLKLSFATDYKITKTDLFVPDNVSNDIITSDNKKINFNHPSWASAYNSTNTCALYKWTNDNNVVWDGISNYNAC